MYVVTEKVHGANFASSPTDERSKSRAGKGF